MMLNQGSNSGAQYGAGATRRPQMASSPAIDAMRQTGTRVNAPSGAAPQSPAPAATPAASSVPAIPVQQVDTSRMDQAYGQQDATYQQMLADQQKMWGDTQHMIQQNFSGQLTRNASNAARMGLQAGGASYLSGTRSALNQAGNYARQANMDALNQRIGIQGQQAGAYGQRAGAYGQVAGQNTAAQNNANVAQYQTQTQLDRDKAAAQAEQNTNQNIAAAKQIRTDFDYLFNKNNFKEAKGQYESLVGRYETALATGNDQEIAVAYNNLMSFITPYQQKKEQGKK